MAAWGHWGHLAEGACRGSAAGQALSMGKRRNDPAIGQRIRDHRQELGLTQRDLGRRLGVSYQLVQAYEHGRRVPNTDRLECIATELKMATY